MTLRIITSALGALAFSACASAPAPLPAAAPPVASAGAAPTGGATLVRNAKWWMGGSFETGERTIRDGRFVAPGGPVEQEIDLEGAFVIPPLGDAHVHMFHAADYIDQTAGLLSSDGILTAWELGGWASEVASVRSALKDTPMRHVGLAGPAFTAPGAHAIPYTEAQAQELNWWSLPEEEKLAVRYSRTVANERYYDVADPAAVDAVWQDYLSLRPDLVKVIIFGSADGTREDPTALDKPTVLHIGELARAASLRLIAHVQTPEDAELAIDAGAAVLAHAPLSHSAVATVPGALLDRLAREDVAVIPTFFRKLAMEPYTPEEYRMSPERVAEVRASHRDRLNMMHAAGVRLALGSDLGRTTALDELVYWHEVGALDPDLLLDIAVLDTPALILGRQGQNCVQLACTADFLVTKDDPRNDFSVIENARLFVNGAEIRRSSEQDDIR